MKPCDFYLDMTGAEFFELDSQNSQATQPSSLAKAMAFPEESIIALDMALDSTGPWAYRFHLGRLFVASLQGSFSVDVPVSAVGKRILLALQHLEGGFFKHLDISVFSDRWSKGNGDPCNPLDFKIKLLSDGSFEPICWRQTFRGQDGFREWVILYLPAPADSIKRCKGQAIIESGGRTFTLPKGEVSDLALKGKIQYALPNEQGNFVFGQIPPHPTDGLMAKVVRDLLSEMGIQKGS